MINDRVIEDRVKRRNQTLAATPRSCTPGGVDRDMRVVHTGVVYNVTAMGDSKKAQQIQADEQRAEQQPVRYGFLSNHGNPNVESTYIDVEVNNSYHKLLQERI